MDAVFSLIVGAGFVVAVALTLLSLVGLVIAGFIESQLG